MDLIGAARLQILSVLAKAPAAGLSLQAISKELKRKPPPVFFHLKEMVQVGLIERVEAARPHGPLYRARRFLHVTWIDPESRKIASWESNEPVSWRFPLVSRVPDAPAQAVLRTLIPQFEQRYLDLLEQKGARALPFLTHATRESAFTFVVYGSCARGDARPASDLDLLLVQPSGPSVEAAVRDLVAEANLWASRKIDLRVVRRKTFRSLPEDLRETLRREGLTVYSTHLGGAFEEVALEGGEG